jgi:glyoxylase-like metal-dependent hydrolase (beta-lactamase superfamily II)
VLEGSGGNITIFDGPDGKLMVDSGIAISQQKLKKVLTNISKTPIKYLINIYWHFDHTKGNEWVHKAGATILVNEKRVVTYQRLSG